MARRDVTLTRISPMSAFRVGLAMSLVGLVAWILAVCIMYFALDQAGIWDSLNRILKGVAIVTATLTILAIVVVTALAFDFTNGFHDTANAMATSTSLVREST